jgi:hypothetical protein
VLEVINSKRDQTEERIGQLEDRLFEIMQIEEKKRKRNEERL